MHGQGGFGSCYLCGTRSSEDLCINKTLSNSLTQRVPAQKINAKLLGVSGQGGSVGKPGTQCPYISFFSSDTEAFVVPLSIHSMTHAWVRPFLFISLRKRQSCTLNSTFLSSFPKAENLSHVGMEHTSLCLQEKPGCAPCVPSPLFSSFLHFNPQ